MIIGLISNPLTLPSARITNMLYVGVKPSSPVLICTSCYPSKIIKRQLNEGGRHKITVYLTLLCRMGYNENNNRVFTDPQTGEKPALALIKQIGIEGKKDPDRLQMYALILRGMEFLRTHGLQDSFKEYFKTHLEDGNPYTILLVKELRDHVPLLEFRVNWKETGGFRAIFFEQQIDGNQILIFVNAVVKKRHTIRILNESLLRLKKLIRVMRPTRSKLLLFGR